MPTGHKNGTHAIIISMLVALLALETTTLGYVVTKVGETPSTVSTVATKTSNVPPIFYTRATPGVYSSPRFNSQLVMIDRTTGAETILFDGGLTTFVDIVAAPQKKYDGVIYVDKYGEGGEHVAVNLQKFDVATKTFSPINLSILPIGVNQMFVSPDQTKVAVLDEYPPTEGPGGSYATVYDLKTGEGIKNFPLIAGEDFFAGTSEMGLKIGYEATWISDKCIYTTIYRAKSTDSTSANYFKKFCIE